MKKLLFVVAIAAALTGCQTFSKLTGATVSPQAMLVAANSFDAVESTATNYIGYCTPNPKPAGCNVNAIKQLIPAIRAGRIARNNIEAFVAGNPGKLGATGLYNALTTVTATLSQIEVQYGIGSK